MDGAKTGEEFLDLLQSYGIISRFHVTYIPWLLHKADGGRDLVKDWRDIEKKIPPPKSSLFVSNLPTLPTGNFRIEIQVQLKEDGNVHIFRLQKQLHETLDNLPSELICFLGATRIKEHNDWIILTIQMPSSRRGKKLRNIPDTLYNHLMSVPYWIHENNVIGVHVGKKHYTTFKEVEEGSEEPVDLTRVPGATGQEVVHRTCEIVDEIFPPNKGILRRIAWVETGDGNNYYDEDDTGGIWHVSKEKFEETKDVSKNPKLKEFHDKIKAAFGIVWEELGYDQCDTPLYSAIAARICLLATEKEIPGEADVKEQALFWEEINCKNRDYTTKAAEFVLQVEKLPEVEEHNLSKMDLAIVVDGSGSVGASDFSKAKDFIRRLVDTLPIGTEEVRVGVIQFTDQTTVEFPMNTHTTNDSLKTAISEIRYQQGGTRTGQALTAMTDTMFSIDNGARPLSDSVPRVGIVLTDGQSSGSDPPQKPADKARSEGITVIAIGIGGQVRNTELDQIANKPSEKYSVKNIAGFEHVDGILSKVLAEASKAPVEISTNKAIKGTSEKKGEKRRFCFPIPENKKYVTVSMQISQGEGAMYLSTSHDPSSVAYQWKLETSTTLSFDQAQVKLSKASEGGKKKIYATFENTTSRGGKEKQQLTTFYVIVEEEYKKVPRDDSDIIEESYGQKWQFADSSKSKQ
ncbi:uncharacterized protein [Amphiura filiformis]